MARNPADKAFYARGRRMHRLADDQQGYLPGLPRPRRTRKSSGVQRPTTKDKPSTQG